MLQCQLECLFSMSIQHVECLLSTILQPGAGQDRVVGPPPARHAGRVLQPGFTLHGLGFQLSAFGFIVEPYTLNTYGACFQPLKR